MTPRRSIVGTLALSKLFSNPRRRRAILGVGIVISAVLTFFPQQYRSAVTLAPADPSLFGLGGTLGQLGAAANVFGNQAAVEVTLRVASSRPVRQVVIDKLDLTKRLGFSSSVQTHRWLQRELDARSLRGNIVQIETKQSDPEFAEQLIEVYSSAIRNRLTEITEQQTQYKRSVLKRLVAEANDDYMRAQAEYDAFRRTNRFATPQRDIDAIGQRILVLRAEIKAKEVQLNTERQFATDENISVRQIIAQLAELKRQLAELQQLNPDSNTVGRAVQESTRADRLERDLVLARALYEAYSRFLQGTAVEDLTSSANLRVIEPPFVDTTRQINLLFAALTALLLLFAATLEFYLLRPPLEARPT